MRHDFQRIGHELVKLVLAQIRSRGERRASRPRRRPDRAHRRHDHRPAAPRLTRAVVAPHRSPDPPAVVAPAQPPGPYLHDTPSNSTPTP